MDEPAPLSLEFRTVQKNKKRRAGIAIVAIGVALTGVGVFGFARGGAEMLGVSGLGVGVALTVLGVVVLMRVAKQRPADVARAERRRDKGSQLMTARPSVPRLFLITFTAVGCATLLRLALDPWVRDRVPYALHLAAVAAAARFGDRRSGAAAVVLSLGLASTLFASPRGSLWLAHAGDRVSAMVFIAVGAIIVWTIDAERQARRAVEARDARLREEALERQRLEAALAESRRLDSIGRLAGGIAHDFNNLLMIVQGSAHLLERSPTQSPLIENIEVAARRGAELNRQLLGFARRQMLELRPIPVDDAVTEATQLVARLLPEDIRLEVVRDGRGWTFAGDSGQVQQVLLNLITNARDALPNGGTITVSTGTATLDQRFAEQNPEVTPGEYVQIEVTDDGQGISEEALPHIFEPFFSTKEVGSGTGLGLAVVYGIVKQHKGHIFAHSTLGRGSHFQIFLPRTAAVVLSGPRPESNRRPSRALHVLVVEDDDVVRATTRQLLETLGHEVTTAANGAEAFAASDSASRRFDVLLTDVVLPWMNGRQVAERLRERGELAVVFMSGYTDNVVLQKGVVEEGVILLRKPFSITELESALSDALSGTGKRHSGSGV